MLTSLELCAGAGGQALGLEKAGFEHEALVEIDSHCCDTLRANRPGWNVIEDDLRVFKERASDFKGVDLIAGGVPCPPFSLAGKQLGERDERNLFPDALDIIDVTRPRIIGMLKHLGFDHRHAAMTLNGAAGHLPESHRWQRDALGHYSLLS